MVRVVHFESGLGNQMLDYCDFIAIKKMNPTVCDLSMEWFGN